MSAQRIEDYCRFVYNDKVIVGQSFKAEAKRKTSEKIVCMQERAVVNVKLRRRLFIFFVSFFCMMGIVALQNKMAIDKSYEIAKMKFEIGKLQKENESVKVEIAKLKSPHRIEEIAVSQMGMVVPKTIYYVKSNQGEKNKTEGKELVNGENIVHASGNKR